MADPLPFENGIEDTSISSLVSGLMTLQEVFELTNYDEQNKLLKSHGLSDYEIKIYNDSKKGVKYLETNNKNFEKSALCNLLKEIHTKINGSEKIKSSTSSQILTEATKKPLIHPILELNKLKDDLFGHINVDKLPTDNKQRKIIRRVIRKLNTPLHIPEPKLEKTITKVTHNSLSGFVKVNDINQDSIQQTHLTKSTISKWDIKDTNICANGLSNKVEVNKVGTKRKIGCSPNSLYTIKDNKIVRVERDSKNPTGYKLTDMKIPINKTEEKLLEGTKLVLSDIKQIPKFKSYTVGLPSKVLYIKNLSKNTKEEDLKSLFENYQNYTNIRLMKGKMKGQAFVTFDSMDTATLALQEKNGVIVKGKPIIIDYGKQGNMH